MAKKIYLSPSNQYANTYATGGTNEMAQCDKIAAETAKALKRCGFEVKVGKSGTLMQTRCVESDNFKADVHMPIHTNAFNGKYTGGTRIFCLNENGKKACDAVLKELGKLSPGTADSVRYEKNLYEINVPKALTIYVECEFHDTKEGASWIIKNTKAIAEAICKGLCSYFKVTYKAEGATSVTKPAPTTKPSSGFKSYVIRITSENGVNIRSGAGTSFKIKGAIDKGGAYTIVEEKNGWGKLKSGAGWIYLKYTEKIKK